jgi:amino acid adenylation domain-containing protein
MSTVSPHSADNGEAEYDFPLSLPQARLLVMDRVHLGSAQYHVPVAFAVDGPFDITAFRAGLGAVVNRHESLRTVFRATGDEYVQVITAQAEPAVHVGLPIPPADVDETMLADAGLPFDVEHGPLLRCSVYPVTDGTQRILLTAHHLVCDGWSLQAVLQELGDCYRAALHGQQADLAPLSVQYGDYAAWQRERQELNAYADAAQWWAKQLRDSPAMIALPSRQPRPAVQTTAARSLSFMLPEATRIRLARIAALRRTTSFAVLFAAFNAFLSRITGADDLVVGVPVSGRDLPELQQMVGMLANTLALRTDLRGNPSFYDLVGRVRMLLDDARPYQDTPFDAVVDALSPERALSHDPLVQVAFSYDDETELTLSLHGATVTRVPLTLEAAKFDFLMHVERAGPDLAVQVIYRSDLFDQDTVRHWARSFQVLLEQLLDRPDQPVGAANILDPADRTAVLEIFNATFAPAGERFAHDLVADRAAEDPDAIALVCGDTVLSYRELLERADRLAGQLRSAGVGPEVPVAICLPRSAGMAVAALAVLRAGGAYLPLDPKQPFTRLEYMLSDARARLVITDPRTASLLNEAGRPAGVLTAGATRLTLPAGMLASRDTAQAALRPANTAYIVYTSGSTGAPKGVMIEHRALANLVTAVRAQLLLTAKDRVLQYVSFGFDAAVADVFSTWATGAELHIAGEFERLGDALLARLRDSRISHVLLPPAAVMSLPSGQDVLPDLRTLVVGGEQFPPELAGRWSAAGRTVINAYGPTETTVYATMAEIVPGEQVTIGAPLANTRAYILDSRLSPVPVGVVGEVYLAGRGVGRGYAHRPGLTAERFVANPFGPPGSRFYRTGDLARYTPEGTLIFQGRSDGQVKVRGFRIELGEIEAIIAAHPGVEAAAVAAHGTGDHRRLVAYVTGRSGSPPDTAELRAWLAERLPGYMLPEAVLPLDGLPTSRSGKIDRARLPMPPSARPELAQSFAAPATPAQRRLASIWKRVLGLNQIGIYDNFFDLGGNSVRLLAVLAALKDPGSLDARDDITLVDLFQYPNIAALAARLDKRDGPPSNRASAKGRGDSRRELIATRSSAARSSAARSSAEYPNRQVEERH